MTIELVPFHFKHLEYIKPGSVQTEEWEALLRGGVEDQLMSGLAMSLWQSGQCLGAAGLIPFHRGYAQAWSFFGERVGYAAMRKAVKCMRQVLANEQYKRIDMLVRKGNIHGCMLARAAGFEYETTLEAVHHSGDDMHVFKRIKK